MLRLEQVHLLSDKRVALYCRVSTFDQAKGEFSSLDSQEKDLREFAGNKNWDIIRVYRDSSSGANLDRPELQKMLRDMPGGIFDIVAVTKLDRISRNPKDIYALDDLFQKSNCDFISQSQDIDTTTSQGKFFRDLLMLFAQFEREMIAERTYVKLHNQAKEGRWAGVPPLGYELVDKKLVIKPDEKIIVQKMYEYYLENPNMGQVAKRLNDEGYRQKQYTTKNGVDKGGGLFRKTTIRNQLQNITYIGKLKFNEFIFEGIHKPIIDNDTFEKVKILIKRQGQNQKIAYHSKHELLLLGILKCGYCGSAITTSFTTKKKTGKRYLYYKCSRQNHFEVGICPQKQIAASGLDKAIRKLLSNLSQDKALMEKTIKQAKIGNQDTIDSLKTEIKRIGGKLAQLNNEENSLITTLKKNPQLSQIASVGKELENIQTSIKHLNDEKHILKMEIDKISSEIINADILKMIYKDFDKIYDELDFDDRQKAVRLLIKEIKLYHHKNDPVNTKIEMALWNKQSLGPLLLSESESSTFGRLKLRR